MFAKKGKLKAETQISEGLGSIHLGSVFDS